MGLSSFIKQLLETDSVFGVEAKKLTGINDGGPIFDVNASDYFNEDSNFNLIHAVLGDAESSIDLNPIPKSGDDPDLIRITFKNIIKGNIFYNLNFTRSVPIRLSLLGISSTISLQMLETVSAYNKFIYNIYNIDVADLNNIIVDLSVGEKGGPDFSNLISLTDLKPTQVVCDPRVFALIDDSLIAKKGPQGSTIFNLDNIESNDDLFGLSGIASKYAAHYHSEQQVNLISHEKDENGNDLVHTIQSTYTPVPNIDMIYNEANVIPYLNSFDPPIRTADIRIDYSDDISTITASELGDYGLPGVGTVTITGDLVAWPTTDFNSVGFTSSVDNMRIGFSLGRVGDSSTLRFWPDGTSTDPVIRREQQASNLATAMDTIFNLNYTPNPYIVSADGPTVKIIGPRLTSEPAVLIQNPENNLITLVNVGETDVAPPVQDNQFLSSADLEASLNRVLLTHFSVSASRNGNMFNLTSTNPPSKIVDFINPIDSSDIWEVAGRENTLNVPLGEHSTRIIDGDIEIVLDNSNTLVYTATTPTCD